MHLIVEPVKRSRKKSLVGQVILILVGVQLIFFSAFACFDVPTATGRNLVRFGRNQSSNLFVELPYQWQKKIKQSCPYVPFPLPHEQVRYSSYCAIGPAVIFVSYVMGPALGAVSVLFYLIIGLIGPLLHLFPFSAGGGLDYHLQPSFGYLIGSLLAALACGRITRGRRTSLSQLLGMGAGLLTLHLTGAAYLFGTYLYFYMTEGSKTYLEWQPWIFGYLRNLTWYSLPYDCIFSFLLVGCAFPFRWLASHLMAPDLGPPPEVKYRQRLEEFV